ncbi:CAP domain-containing protein [Massilia sp. S19_KUP03_FR1]|uniref:CAP domain-containing protein n=1 Tax=Massilia sp. S19_KUP03_FR1 TaxID=3025503 RepID=UPI002FCDC51A
MRFARLGHAAFALLALLALPARSSDLVQLINAYRAGPAVCAGRMSPALPPLQARAALAQVHMASGRFLQQDLARAGYRALQVEAIGVRGASDLDSVMQLLREQHCATLRNPALPDIGVVPEGDGWSILLAREDIVPPLPTQAQSTRAILDATNRARATARNCGARAFPAAPPLVLNASLDAAALAHSSEMAALRYFSHQGKDGSQVGERALRAGYRWQQIGENIASGMRTPDDAVAGWVASPGHCANLMNPGFTAMGSGYAKSTQTDIVFWTQVFGR